jgi:hypothetical protein
MERAVLRPVVVTLAAAALLTGGAVYTVNRAGCDDPGRYVRNGDTIELVGGCLEPGDLPVGPPPAVRDDRPNGALLRP